MDSIPQQATLALTEMREREREREEKRILWGEKNTWLSDANSTDRTSVTLYADSFGMSAKPSTLGPN